MKILFVLLFLLEAQKPFVFATLKLDLKNKTISVINSDFDSENVLETSPESLTTTVEDKEEEDEDENKFDEEDENKFDGDDEECLFHPRNKRKLDAFLEETDFIPPVTEALKSCLRGSRVMSNPDVRKLRFSISEDDESQKLPIKGEEADKNYLNALFNLDFKLADKMRRSGLMLSGSYTTSQYIKSLLSRPNFSNVIKIVHVLIRFQPQVFSQDYEHDINVFIGATQDAIEFILDNLPPNFTTKSKIFSASYINSKFKLQDSFFVGLPSSRMIQFMNLSKEMNDERTFLNCCSLIDIENFLEDGENVLTFAIKRKSVDLIDCLRKRKDASNFIDLPNDMDECPLDLALDLHFVHKVDPDFSVFINFFDVLKPLVAYDCFPKAKILIQYFGDKVFCTGNPQLLKAFKDFVSSIQKFLAPREPTNSLVLKLPVNVSTNSEKAEFREFIDYYSCQISAFMPQAKKL